MAIKKTSSSKLIDEDTMPETDVSKDFINFFVDGLKVAYWSEKRLLKLYRKIVKAAAASYLKHLFEEQLAAAQVLLDRLEQIFELLNEAARAKKHESVDGFAEDAHEIIEKTDKGSTRDAALILAFQKIQAYEIETYTALVHLARKAGNEDIISTLEEILSEKHELHVSATALVESTGTSAIATADPEI